MKYYININQVEKKIDFFKKELENIDEKVKHAKKLPRNLIWEGDAADKFMKKYENYIDNLEDLEMGLLHYIKTLVQFDNKYNHVYDEMEKRFKVSLIELGSEIDDQSNM